MSTKPHSNGKVTNRVFTKEELETGHRILYPKTRGQREYMETIDRSIITLCAGVAGTGKTYIATAKAIEMYQKGIVKKVLFCRPNVPCGKGLGYLPGELEDKFFPYVRPFQDALNDFINKSELERLVEADIFEFMPPDYMNGCTFKDTVMLLDEAQNAEAGQLNMFLTRIGEGSRMIVTGNPAMCDLDPRKGTPYRDILNVMNRKPYIDGIEIVTLGVEDIVRSSIVQKIVEKIGE